MTVGLARRRFQSSGFVAEFIARRGMAEPQWVISSLW